MRFVNVRGARDAYTARALELTAWGGMVENGAMSPGPGNGS